MITQARTRPFDTRRVRQEGYRPSNQRSTFSGELSLARRPARLSRASSLRARNNLVSFLAIPPAGYRRTIGIHRAYTRVHTFQMPFEITQMNDDDTPPSGQEGKKKRKKNGRLKELRCSRKGTPRGDSQPFLYRTSRKATGLPINEGFRCNLYLPIR